LVGCFRLIGQILFCDMGKDLLKYKIFATYVSFDFFLTLNDIFP